MSVQASSWVIKHSKHKGSALLLLLMIANHAHADGSNAFPSVKTLAEECRMSERQIIRLIVKLEKSGELLIEKSRGRTAHNYAVNMSANTDKMSTLNTDKMSRSAKANPGKSGNPTLTNRAFAYKEEPSLEKSGEVIAPAAQKLSVDEAVLYLETEAEVSPEKSSRAQVIYRVYFPNVILKSANVKGMALIENLNEVVWRKTLTIWRDNGNKASNIGDLIDRYKNELERAKQVGSGSRPPPETLPTAAELQKQREEFNKKPRMEMPR